MKTIAMLMVLLGAQCTMAQQIIKFDLWKNSTAPHKSTLTAPQSISKEGHILNSQTGSVELYLPKIQAQKCVLICPGGGYGIVAIEHEGRAFARMLSDNGIAAAVLCYRIPNGTPEIPLEDAEQALKLLRKNYQFKIGIMGFSAGGHLASNVCVRDNLAFSVLFYPVISSNSDIIHNGSFNSLTGGKRELYDLYSAEKNVTKKTPPALLFHSLDDKAVLPANSEIYRDSLLNHGVTAELVLFNSGGHGWGFDLNLDTHEQMCKKLLDFINKI